MQRSSSQAVASEPKKVLILVCKWVLTDRSSVHCDGSQFNQSLVYSIKLSVKIYHFMYRVGNGNISVG